MWYLVLGYPPFSLTLKSQYQTILNHFQSFLYQKKPWKKGVVFSNRIHTFFSNIKIKISNHFKSFSIVFVSKIGLGKKMWYLVIGYNCESFSIVFVSKIGLGKKVWYLVIGYNLFF